jgi:MinD-like ATPase involved in chromosome partitioning or flagellar assembly
VTDHDDLAPKPPVPAPDEQPAGPPEDTPPQQWSGPAERQGGQHAAPHGFPSEPAPWQPPPRGMGYNEETRIMPRAPQTDQPLQRWQQPAPPQEPSTSASKGGQEPYGGAPPTDWNYVESIRTSELVPTRKLPPGHGWRRLVYNATFKLVNLGQSPGELRQAQLEAKIRTLLRGRYKIGVLGKGGVGKTTVAAAVGSIFADLRQDDRVVAIDADTAFGKLGARIDPHVVGSYWDVANDQHLDTFADMRSRVGNNAVGLFVLAGEPATARRRVLDPAIYREAVWQLDRHFTISIVDCGASLDVPVTQEVLGDLDALIVVSSPWVDGASAAGQTLEWLANHQLADLLHRTVVVLSDSDGHSDKRTRTILAQQFASRGQVVIEVPFDPHLRPGGVIDVANEMNPKTRRRFYELAAAIADHFPSTTHGRRDQRLR